MLAVVQNSPYAVAQQEGMSRDLYDRFIAYLDSSPKTIETYTKNLKPFFAYLNSHSIARPARLDILAYRESLKGKLKPTTIQNYLAVVKIFFAWTEQEGLYPNIAKRIKGPKIDRAHKKDYLTSGQVKQIAYEIDRSTVTGSRDYAIFMLMVSCGLRTIEVSLANVEDLRPVGDKTVLYVQGKGKTERSIFVLVPFKVEQVIRQYLKHRPEAKDKDPLFASTSNNNKGCRLTTRSISGIAKRLMRAGGFNSSRLTAHSLRHTAVTAAVNSGQRFDLVQAFARHANPATTMIYVHHEDALKNQCSTMVSDMFFD